jgi:hypothetical protein
MSRRGEGSADGTQTRTFVVPNRIIRTPSSRWIESFLVTAALRKQVATLLMSTRQLTVPSAVPDSTWSNSLNRDRYAEPDKPSLSHTCDSLASGLSAVCGLFQSKRRPARPLVRLPSPFTID